MSSTSSTSASSEDCLLEEPVSPSRMPESTGQDSIRSKGTQDVLEVVTIEPCISRSSNTVSHRRAASTGNNSRAR
eukprot:2667938-Amphidinium_carterae.1